MVKNDHATVFLRFINLLFFGRFQHEEEFSHVHNKRESEGFNFVRRYITNPLTFSLFAV